MNKFLEAALSYESIGLSVIPLSPHTKVPPSGFDVVSRRTKRATSKEIKGWWAENPNYNVGIVTGEISNLLVVDFDKYKPKYNEETALSLIPDNIIVPTSTTPRGGVHHWFFNNKEITSKTDIAPGIDIKAELGYIVAPPSLNGSGNGYKWVEGMSIFDVGRADTPSSLLKAINNKSTLYMGEASRQEPMRDNIVTSVTKRDIWEDGVRDENLFHVALCMVKTDNDQDYIRQTLRAIISSWGERDERWIDAKIKSAIDRIDKTERNLAAEIDAWISVTERDFCVTEMDKELKIVTKRDMATRRKHLSRRKDVTIEKAGTRDGWWRKINNEIAFMDFDAPDEKEFKVKLPFELSNVVKIMQGNIILVSGEYNAGKSTFALNVLVDNRNRVPIRYMSSEMKANEIKERFRGFGLRKEDYWPNDMCQYVEIHNNIPKLILPDGLNIIDYMEFPNGDYTLGAEYMRQIHDCLKTGITVVCNQQKEGHPLPRSGDLILEKPRLAVTLRKIKTENDDILGVAEILKAKNITIGKMDGKKLKYQIVDHGSRFKTITNWGWWRI